MTYNKAVEPITIKVNADYQTLVYPLTADEYNDLKYNIKINGQHIPIIVSDRTGQLVIIDGHHRYKVCQEEGIEPKYEIRHFSHF